MSICFRTTGTHYGCNTPKLLLSKSVYEVTNFTYLYIYTAHAHTCIGVKGVPSRVINWRAMQRAREIPVTRPKRVTLRAMETLSVSGRSSSGTNVVLRTRIIQQSSSGSRLLSLSVLDKRNASCLFILIVLSPRIWPFICHQGTAIKPIYKRRQLVLLAPILLPSQNSCEMSKNLMQHTY